MRLLTRVSPPCLALVCLALLLVVLPVLSDLPGQAQAQPPSDLIQNVPPMKPQDSELKVKVGDQAPDFDLPTIDGGRITLAKFRGVKNVLLSFIPAAWTPVCTGQWPGYNIARELFEANDTILLGASVDNTPTLGAWVRHMGGVWFPVASDFWPHGELAQRLGILRGDGVAERAIFLIDKQGIIRYIDVHDINTRPELGEIVKQMERLRQ